MKPLAPEISDAILAMLDDGCSTLEIRRALGVSRSAVESRRLFAVAPTVVRARCPICGAVLKSPKCLACWLRAPISERGPFRERDFGVPIERDAASLERGLR